MWCLQEEIIMSSIKDSQMNLYLRKTAAGFSHVAPWVIVAKPAVDLTQSELREPTLARSQLQTVCSDSCLSFHYIFLMQCQKVEKCCLCRQFTGKGRQ